MTGKTKNKLTFSKKKTGGVKKKKRASSTATAAAAPPVTASTAAPSVPAAPPAAQPQPSPAPAPVAVPPQAPPPAAQPAASQTAYQSQPTEHPARMPAAQPAASAVPVGRPVSPPVAAPVAVMSKTASPTAVGTPGASPSAGKQGVVGRLVSQPSKPAKAPASFKDTEDLKEQVGNYLEICDSCLKGDCAPTDIIDLIHVLVMSLRLDVVSMALIDPESNGRFRRVVSRGYDVPPTREVVECWETALTAKNELLWDKLMSVATDKKTELAYWIVKANLDSVGYVPIHDGNHLYGFLFVAAKSQKQHSIIKSELLDACGSRLGLAYAEQYEF